MRSKEQAHDYRYFPEPDLPPLVVDEAWLARTRAVMPELPEDRFERYVSTLGLSAQDAGVLVAEAEIATYFDAAVKASGDALAKKMANWLINEVLGRVNDPRDLSAVDQPVPPDALAELVGLVESGTLSGKQGKEVFAKMWTERRRAADVVKAEGLSQVTDTAALEEACRKVVAAKPEEVARWKSGQIQLMGFFVGQVLKETGGKANPKAVNEILRRLLSA
jgi:aspartyl-tRNA(Asn)/glutamyl-tRNA(Gln) amidotransferase subunit B